MKRVVSISLKILIIINQKILILQMVTLDNRCCQGRTCVIGEKVFGVLNSWQKKWGVIIL